VRKVSEEVYELGSSHLCDIGRRDTHQHVRFITQFVSRHPENDKRKLMEFLSTKLEKKVKTTFAVPKVGLAPRLSVQANPGMNRDDVGEDILIDYENIDDNMGEVALIDQGNVADSSEEAELMEPGSVEDIDDHGFVAEEEENGVYAEVPLHSVCSHRVNQNGSIEFEVEYEDTPEIREWVFAREFMDPQTPPKKRWVYTDLVKRYMDAHRLTQKQLVASLNSEDISDPIEQSEVESSVSSDS
jgi:hypothetical protein